MGVSQARRPAEGDPDARVSLGRCPLMSYRGVTEGQQAAQAASPCLWAVLQTHLEVEEEAYVSSCLAPPPGGDESMLAA